MLSCSVMSDSSTTAWTIAHQVSLCTGFYRQDTGVHCQSLLQGTLPTRDQTCISCHVHWQVDSLPPAPLGKPVKMCCYLVTQSYPTLCNPMDCSMPGFPVLHHLPELAQTHVHGVSDAIQTSCVVNNIN